MNKIRKWRETREYIYNHIDRVVLKYIKNSARTKDEGDGLLETVQKTNTALRRIHSSTPTHIRTPWYIYPPFVLGDMLLSFADAPLPIVNLLFTAYKT